jgi:hypothetical protein
MNAPAAISAGDRCETNGERAARRSLSIASWKRSTAGLA